MAHFLQRVLLWLLFLAFVLLYPMLVSIYVFLPLFIGVIGYVLILGIEKQNISYILIALLYFLNMDINLSLPLFLASVAVLIVYVLIYPYLTRFGRCKVCTPFLSVLLIDLVYLGTLIAYDFVFQSENIVLDDILWYPLVVDLLVAVLL